MFYSGFTVYLKSLSWKFSFPLSYLKLWVIKNLIKIWLYQNLCFFLICLKIIPIVTTNSTLAVLKTFNVVLFLFFYFFFAYTKSLRSKKIVLSLNLLIRIIVFVVNQECFQKALTYASMDCLRFFCHYISWRRGKLFLILFLVWLP